MLRTLVSGLPFALCQGRGEPYVLYDLANWRSVMLRSARYGARTVTGASPVVSWMDIHRAKSQRFETKPGRSGHFPTGLASVTTKGADLPPHPPLPPA
jgi:hypothetical protein